MVVITCVISISFNYTQVTKVNKETVSATNASPLQGLRKANFSGLDPSKRLMLDGISTPVYTGNLILVKGNDFMKFMSNGDYFPDIY